jgi:hypothetical protein
MLIKEMTERLNLSLSNFWQEISEKNLRFAGLKSKPQVQMTKL